MTLQEDVLQADLQKMGQLVDKVHALSHEAADMGSDFKKRVDTVFVFTRRSIFAAVEEALKIHREVVVPTLFPLATERFEEVSQVMERVVAAFRDADESQAPAAAAAYEYDTGVLDVPMPKAL